MYSSIGRGLLDERPIVFFDSHPEPPAGIVMDSLSRLKKQLATAWTGDVHQDVQPGSVRLQWYTTDGTYGKRDYELRQHDEARMGFDKLCTLRDVARVMVVGYPSQNPYSIDGRESEYAINERKKQELLKTEYRDFVPREKKEPSIGDRIEDIIQDDDLEGKRKNQKQKFGGQDV